MRFNEAVLICLGLIALVGCSLELVQKPAIVAWWIAVLVGIAGAAMLWLGWTSYTSRTSDLVQGKDAKRTKKAGSLEGPPEDTDIQR